MHFMGIIILIKFVGHAFLIKTVYSIVLYAILNPRWRHFRGDVTHAIFTSRAAIDPQIHKKTANFDKSMKIGIVYKLSRCRQTF
jgi:hypothetical protein